MSQLLEVHAQRLTEKLIEESAAKELERLTSYSLADAIREGCKVTGKMENGWVDDDNACALSAGLIAAKARGWVA